MLRGSAGASAFRLTTSSSGRACGSGSKDIARPMPPRARSLDSPLPRDSSDPHQQYPYPPVRNIALSGTWRLTSAEVAQRTVGQAGVTLVAHAARQIAVARCRVANNLNDLSKLIRSSSSRRAAAGRRPHPRRAHSSATRRACS